ncbi:Tat binding protein 1-interacting protein-domain-containing protein [Globomyces pollinis-pini]|nr:Tat binding protein 1-interacting protein-domain-containing protein [Globomyces pollinis-pini]
MTKPLENEQTELVLNYLSAQNRPYNVTDILNNLKGKVSKANIQKILNEAVESNKIVVKTYGKQMIYCPIQNATDISPDSLNELSMKTNESAKVMEDLKEKVNGNLKLLQKLKNSKTTEDMKAELSNLNAENTNLKEKLEMLQNGTPLITTEEKQRIESDFEEMRQHWKNRKRMFNEMWNTITEHAENPKKLKEKVGFETDEDVKVDFKLVFSL